jgi:hypothetical protein
MARIEHIARSTHPETPAQFGFRPQ